MAVTSEGLEVTFASARFQESPILKEIIQDMLTRNQRQRPGAAALSAKLPVPKEADKDSKGGKAAWS